MPTPTETVAAYLKKLPKDRRAAMSKLRTAIKKNLPKGYREVIGYGMPSYVVPHSLYADGYHCDPELPLPFISIASQSKHIGFYHMGLYADAKLLAWFKKEYAARVPGKLDMGKSCVRFKKLDSIPYDLLGELCAKMTVEEWVRLYEAAVRR